MNIDEIKSKLKSTIQESIIDYFISLGKMNPRGYEMVIHEVDGVYFNLPNEDKLDLKKIFMGEISRIKVEGTLGFKQKHEDKSTTSRQIRFICYSRFSYNTSSNEFNILELENWILDV